MTPDTTAGREPRPIDDDFATSKPKEDTDEETKLRRSPLRIARIATPPPGTSTPA